MKKPDKKLDRFWDHAPGGPASPDRGNAGRTDFATRRNSGCVSTARNSLVAESRFAPLIGFLRFFANPWS